MFPYINPHVRTIVSGEAKDQTEFGARVEITFDVDSVRIERLNCDVCDECEKLKPAIERYYERYGTSQRGS